MSHSRRPTSEPPAARWLLEGGPKTLPTQTPGHLSGGSWRVGPAKTLPTPGHHCGGSWRVAPAKTLPMHAGRQKCGWWSHSARDDSCSCGQASDLVLRRVAHLHAAIQQRWQLHAHCRHLQALAWHSARGPTYECSNPGRAGAVPPFLAANGRQRPEPLPNHWTPPADRGSDTLPAP